MGAQGVQVLEILNVRWTHALWFSGVIDNFTSFCHWFSNVLLFSSLVIFVFLKGSVIAIPKGPRYGRIFRILIFPYSRLQITMNSLSPKTDILAFSRDCGMNYMVIGCVYSFKFLWTHCRSWVLGSVGLHERVLQYGSSRRTVQTPQRRGSTLNSKAGGNSQEKWNRNPAAGVLRRWKAR